MSRLLWPDEPTLLFTTALLVGRYQPHREALLQEVPALRSVPEGSHIWWHVMKKEMGDEKKGGKDIVPRQVFGTDESFAEYRRAGYDKGCNVGAAAAGPCCFCCSGTPKGPMPDAVLREFADPELVKPQHPAMQRIVTSHMVGLSVQFSLLCTPNLLEKQMRHRISTVRISSSWPTVNCKRSTWSFLASTLP